MSDKTATEWMGNRWLIFKTGRYWTVARRRQRSHIHVLPYRIWFTAPTGAEALAEFRRRCA